MWVLWRKTELRNSCLNINPAEEDWVGKTKYGEINWRCNRFLSLMCEEEEEEEEEE
jgi:hypothetical protein